MCEEANKYFTQAKVIQRKKSINLKPSNNTRHRHDHVEKLSVKERAYEEKVSFRLWNYYHPTSKEQYLRGFPFVTQKWLFICFRQNIITFQFTVKRKGNFTPFSKNFDAFTKTLFLSDPLYPHFLIALSWMQQRMLICIQTI